MWMDRTITILLVVEAVQQWLICTAAKKTTVTLTIMEVQMQWKRAAQWILLSSQVHSKVQEVLTTMVTPTASTVITWTRILVKVVMWTINSAHNNLINPLKSSLLKRTINNNSKWTNSKVATTITMVTAIITITIISSLTSITSMVSQTKHKPSLKMRISTL